MSFRFIAVAALVVACGVTAMAQDSWLYDIHILDIRRGTAARATSIPDAGEFNPAWSPNGRKIVHDVLKVGSHSLYVLNVRTGVTAPLAGADGGNDAQWSPDGSIIAFDRVPAGENSIYTVPASGGVASLVRTDAIDVSWAPSGNKIAFVQPSDGSVRTAALSGGASHYMGQGENPAWSPNGKKIVYSFGGDLWLVDVNSSGAPVGSPYALTSGPDWDGQPSWSKNSKEVIFHSNRGGADFNLWRIRVSDGSVSSLFGLVGAGDYDPAVSDNGELVAYAAIEVPGRSLAVSALRGPSTTDICVKAQTSDPVAFPLPQVLKKLKIKVLGADGKVAYVQNLFNVTLTNDEACVSVEGLVPFQIVHVTAQVNQNNDDDNCDEDGDEDDGDHDGDNHTQQSHRRSGEDDRFGGRDNGDHRGHVLKGLATIVLRPDLVIASVNAPHQVNVNAPFSVEAVVRETNMQTGVRATVSLFEGANLLGSVSDVQVHGGGEVSVVFQGITASPVGVHDFVVRVSDANPAEYNTTNNEAAFSVEAIEAAQPMSFSMYYQRLENYSSRYWQTSECYSGYEQTQTGRFENFQFYGSSTPSVDTHAPFDKILWDLGSESGMQAQYRATNLTPSYSYTSEDGSYQDQYNVYDNAVGVNFSLSIGKYVYEGVGYRYMNVQWYKYASNYVYVYRSSDGYTYSYSNEDPDSKFMNAGESVFMRIALEDDGYVTGGSAALNVQPSQPIEGSYSYSYNDGCGITTYGSDYRYDLVYGDAYGMTDPTQLPSERKGGQLPGLAMVPTELNLAPNYPNPFNPSTNLSFTVKEPSHALLKVYNALGEKVAELFNGETEPGRVYQARFNGEGLPTGFYVARLETGGKHLIRKLLLTK